MKIVEAKRFDGKWILTYENGTCGIAPPGMVIPKEVIVDGCTWGTPPDRVQAIEELCTQCEGTGKKTHTIQIDRNLLCKIILDHLYGDLRKAMSSDPKILSISEADCASGKPYLIKFDRPMGRKYL